MFPDRSVSYVPGSYRSPALPALPALGTSSNLSRSLRSQNRLLSPRPCRDDRDGAAGFVLDEADVILGGLGKLFEIGDSDRRLVPSFHGAIFRLVVMMRDREGGKSVPALAVNVVAGAHRNLFEVIEHVDLRQRDAIQSVEHH